MFFNDWNVGLEDHHLRSGTGRGELVISRDIIHISPTSLFIGTEMTVNCVSQDGVIRNPFGVEAHQSHLPSADAFESSTAIGDNAMNSKSTFSL